MRLTVRASFETALTGLLRMRSQKVAPHPEEARSAVSKDAWHPLGRLLAAVAVLLSLATPALAVQPDEVLKDPALEARARTLGRDLRCLVCQNQSIDDSDADLARDLRILLRQRLVAGDSDAQAKQYLVDRYGDYVLLRPPFKATTLVLWLGPGALLLAALGAAVGYYRRRQAAEGSAQPLSEAEQRRLAGLLKDQ